MPPGIAPRLPPGRDRPRPRHPAGGTAAAEERDVGPRAARGGVGRPRGVLQPPSPCSEDAGSPERVGRVVCTARSRVGPRGAAGARGVPAKPFYPLRNKGSSCVLPGAQPGPGHRSPEHGPGAFGDRSIQPKTPPAGKSPVPAPLPGVTPAPSPQCRRHGRRAEGLVLGGHVPEGKVFEQERFLSRGFSFSISSFEGGRFE